jgi:hypothetical protein
MRARPKCSSRQRRKSTIDDGRPGFSFLAKTYPVSTFKDMLCTKGKEQGTGFAAQTPLEK